MNKRYRVVWSEAVGAWIVVPEFAKARGKSTRAHVAGTGVLLTMAAGSAYALGPPNSFSVGLFGSTTECLNSSAAGLLSTGSQCFGGVPSGVTAGTIMYGPSGATDTWSTIDSTNGISMGAGGRKALTISSATGLTAYTNLSMNTTGKIVNMGAGDVNYISEDAINGSQLFYVSASAAQALGGGADVNEDGTLTMPSYTINGETSHSVGDAFADVDTVLTSLSTDVGSLSDFSCVEVMRR